MKSQKENNKCYNCSPEFAKKQGYCTDCGWIDEDFNWAIAKIMMWITAALGFIIGYIVGRLI